MILEDRTWIEIQLVWKYKGYKLFPKGSKTEFTEDELAKEKILILEAFALKCLFLEFEFLKIWFKENDIFEILSYEISYFIFKIDKF